MTKGKRINMEPIISEYADAIIIIETMTLRVVYANKSTESFLGLPLGKILGHKVLEISFAFKQALLDLISAAILNKHPKVLNLNVGNHGTFGEMMTYEVSVSHPDYLPGQVLLVAKDVTELSIYRGKEHLSQPSLRKLSDHTRNVLEEERKQTARDIHDVIGGAISGMIIELSSIQKKLHPDSPEVKRVGAVIANANDVMSFTRAMVTSLRPGLLDRFGLLPALEWLSKSFGESHGVDCYVVNNISDLNPSAGDAGEEFLKLSTVQSTHLFRIVQEALNNVLQHSKATLTRIVLDLSGQTLTLRILDNGVGFSKNRPRLPTLGLLGMQERARCANGTARITSKPGKGTTVTVKVRMADWKEKHEQGRGNQGGSG